MGVNVAALVRLMLVTDDVLLEGRDPIALARAAVRGGVTSVQLRLKRVTPRELLAIARTLVRALDVPVLVNDRPDVAVAAGAAGVHLGPDDAPVALIRRVVPPGFVIGASVGSVSEVPAGEGADFWGIGPWRVTGTKSDAGAALGDQVFAELVRLAGGRPCIAIGGVRPEDVGPVRAAGGAGVAVASGILASDDVAGAARAYAAASGLDAPPRSPADAPRRSG
jgi:thiamine-phosphate pyrophosphorylase